MKKKSNTTKDRSDANKNDNFLIIVNSEIKKAFIAADPKQPKGIFPKDPLQSGRLFLTLLLPLWLHNGLNLQKYWLCYSSSMD